MRRTLLLASCLFLSAGSLLGQPSLGDLWARHDRFVLEADPKPAEVPASCSTLFKGRHGQTVEGWDVGDPGATVVLWWAGGPGGKPSPQEDAYCLPKPKAFRHLEIAQPGTGRSTWLPNWQPEDTVDDAVAFLKLRGIEGPVLVAGWSWGSTMALRFAQRHPERVRGVVVGGVWANTPAEVAYYMDAGGTRSWVPGMLEAFRAFSTGTGSACDLHHAISLGLGGEALCQAYDRAEAVQCVQGENARQPVLDPVPRTPGSPVDLATETNRAVRFAFIESEMMCRGQRGRWALPMRFPKALGSVPLIVIQGRYDQVCDPRVARAVFKAWPDARKLFVPMNGGHWNFHGPTKELLDRAGLTLDAQQRAQLEKADQLQFGSAYALFGSAIGALADLNSD